MESPFAFHQFTPRNHMVLKYTVQNDPYNMADDNAVHLMMANAVNGIEGLVFNKDNISPIISSRTTIYTLKEGFFKDCHVIRVFTGSLAIFSVLGDRAQEIVETYRQQNFAEYAVQAAERQQLLDKSKIEIPHFIRVMWVNVTPIGWMELDPVTGQLTGQHKYFFEGKILSYTEQLLGYRRLKEDINSFAPKY